MKWALAADNFGTDLVVEDQSREFFINALGNAGIVFFCLAILYLVLKATGR